MTLVLAVIMGACCGSIVVLTVRVRTLRRDMATLIFSMKLAEIDRSIEREKEKPHGKQRDYVLDYLRHLRQDHLLEGPRK